MIARESGSEGGIVGLRRASLEFFSEEPWYGSVDAGLQILQGITKVAVHTRRLKANASANRYGEPVIEVRCEEFDCGVVMLQDSRRINIDACDHHLGEAMVILWNDMKMNEIVKEWYTAEGEKGFIKASRFFLKCFGEMALTMFAKFEAEESSVG